MSILSSLAKSLLPPSPPKVKKVILEPLRFDRVIETARQTERMVTEARALADAIVGNGHAENGHIKNGRG